MDLRVGQITTDSDRRAEVEEYAERGKAQTVGYEEHEGRAPTPSRQPAVREQDQAAAKPQVQ
jgi:hypothetical protein